MLPHFQGITESREGLVIDQARRVKERLSISVRLKLPARA
jgi:hypothetical protein